MFSSNCCFLTCIWASQEAGKVVWYSHLLKNFPQFVVIHIAKALSVVSEAEVDVFLEFSCFFSDPMDVGNLISGSSVFSKSSLNIWKLSVHILLKPRLKDFEHYLDNIWNDLYCTADWIFFGLALLGIGMKSDLFQCYSHCWVSKFAGTLSAALQQHHFFRSWNSSSGIH